jgi:hypothetical protein
MTGWKRISERGYQQIFRKRRSKVQATVGTDTATNSNDCREISCRRRNALIQKKDEMPISASRLCDTASRRAGWLTSYSHSL